MPCLGLDLDLSVTAEASVLGSSGPCALGPARGAEFNPHAAVHPAVEHARIVIVDHQVQSIQSLRAHLRQGGYRHFLTTTDPHGALELIEDSVPDLVLLDIEMPEVGGLKILSDLRQSPRVAHIPVILLAECENRQAMLQALGLGVTDFVAKPVDSLQLLPRVRNGLIAKAHYDHIRDYAENLERQVQTRTEELARSRLEMIHCLGRAAEYRDNDTGRHVIRVGRYVGVIARELKLSAAEIEILELASPLHDMGKLGVPDEILLKPSKLDPQEFEIMQRHCLAGKRAFEPMSRDEWEFFQRHTVAGEKIFELGRSPIFQVASRIALTHHEKWDGNGYPLGLAGEDIPLEGRITAVADVFDALSSKRSYKAPLPLGQCFEIMEAERGRHFDPKILDAFFARREEIIAIRIELADKD